MAKPNYSYEKRKKEIEKAKKKEEKRQRKLEKAATEANPEQASPEQTDQL